MSANLVHFIFWDWVYCGISETLSYYLKTLSFHVAFPAPPPVSILTFSCPADCVILYQLGNAAVVGRWVRRRLEPWSISVFAGGICTCNSFRLWVY